MRPDECEAEPAARGIWLALFAPCLQLGLARRDQDEPTTTIRAHVVSQSQLTHGLSGSVISIGRRPFKAVTPILPRVTAVHAGPPSWKADRIDFDCEPRQAIRSKPQAAVGHK